MNGLRIDEIVELAEFLRDRTQTDDHPLVWKRVTGDEVLQISTRDYLFTLEVRIPTSGPKIPIFTFRVQDTTQEILGTIETDELPDVVDRRHVRSVLQDIYEAAAPLAPSELSEGMKRQIDELRG